MQVYLVGGAVRDELLGLDVKDRDWVVVGATPDYFLNKGYQAVGKDFPVFLHPDTQEEYALARTERKVAPGYHGFELTYHSSVTLEEDLFRRDLTINAMAKDHKGHVIDPYGGLNDLASKTLRHVSDHFAEDPVRVLRVARFMARYAHLGFTLADETQALMTQLGESGELDQLTPERIWLELQKALLETTPSMFFSTLREAKVLHYIFPEIDQLFGVPQNPVYHPEVDTGIHTLMVVDQARSLSDDIAVIFAALTHDLGKYITHCDPLIEEGKHANHEERGVPLVKSLCERLKVPSYVQKLAVFTSRYHTHCHRAYDLNPKTLHRLYKYSDYKRNHQFLECFFTACTADARGRLGFEQADYSQPNYIKGIFNTLIDINIPKKFALQGYSGQKLVEKIRIMEIQYLADIVKNPDDIINEIVQQYAEFFKNIKEQSPEMILSNLHHIGFFNKSDYRFRQVIEKIDNKNTIDKEFLYNIKSAIDNIDIPLIKSKVSHLHEVKDTLRMEKIAIIQRLMQVGNS